MKTSADLGNATIDDSEEINEEVKQLNNEFNTYLLQAKQMFVQLGSYQEYLMMVTQKVNDDIKRLVCSKMNTNIESLVKIGADLENLMGQIQQLGADTAKQIQNLDIKNVNSVENNDEEISLRELDKQYRKFCELFGYQRNSDEARRYFKEADPEVLQELLQGEKETLIFDEADKVRDVARFVENLQTGNLEEFAYDSKKAESAERIDSGKVETSPMQKEHSYLYVLRHMSELGIKNPKELEEFIENKKSSIELMDYQQKIKKENNQEKKSDDKKLNEESAAKVLLQNPELKEKDHSQCIEDKTTLSQKNSEIKETKQSESNPDTELNTYFNKMFDL